MRKETTFMGIWVGWKAQLSYQEFIFLLTFMESSRKKIIQIANILVYLSSVLSVYAPHLTPPHPTHPGGGLATATATYARNLVGLI